MEVICCLIAGAAILHFTVSDPCLAGDPFNVFGYFREPQQAMAACAAKLRSSRGSMLVGGSLDTIDAAAEAFIRNRGLTGDRASKVRKVANDVKLGGTIDPRLLEKAQPADLALAARYGCDAECLKAHLPR